MEIRISKYVLPFRESARAGVHFIPRDCYLEMLDGMYSAHIDAYKRHLESQSYIIEIDDPISGEKIIHHIDGPYLRPLTNTERDLIQDEIDYLEELFFQSGIQAAGRRVGRLV